MYTLIQWYKIMKKKELEKLCNQELTVQEIADTLGEKKSKVKYWIRKFSLSTCYKYKHFCKGCGEDKPENFYKDTYSECKKCRNAYRYKRAKDKRTFVIKELGGCCQNCGFDKYRASLDVHHTNPSLKDPNFDSMRSWSIERLTKEIKSCILLCKNCHSAFHSGELTLR